MADLFLAGMLNLSGPLTLAADGGRVMVGPADLAHSEVLVADSSQKTVHASGVPVMQPPGGSLDPGEQVRIVSSFNTTVSVKLKHRMAPIVALGMTLQGANIPPPWPGMVLPNSTHQVKANGVAININGDSGVTFPNGGSNHFTNSGQG